MVYRVSRNGGQRMDNGGRRMDNGGLRDGGWDSRGGDGQETAEPRAQQDA